jgi:hypothetical protein
MGGRNDCWRRPVLLAGHRVGEARRWLAFRWKRRHDRVTILEQHWHRTRALLTDDDG